MPPLLTVLPIKCSRKNYRQSRKSIFHDTVILMKKKPRRGRPPKGDEALAGRIQVRVTEEEAEEIKRAAKRAGGTPSTWGRPLLLTAARER